MKSKIILAVGFSLLLLGALVAYRSQNDFAAKLQRSAFTALANGSNRVAPSSVTKFAWERLFIFRPYESLERIEQQLGFKWPAGKQTGIEASESFYLLVFCEDNIVRRHIMFSRNVGHFDRLTAKNVFTNGTDFFHVELEDRTKPNGRLLFRPESVP